MGGDGPESGGLKSTDLLTLVERLSEAPSIEVGLDLLCRVVITASNYSRACAVILMPASGNVFGAAGIDRSERARLRKAHLEVGAPERIENRARVLRLHRLVEGLDLVFVPEGAREGLPSTILNGPAGAGSPDSQWCAGDELVLLPHAADGSSLGMLAVAEPRDGCRPAEADLPALRRLLTLTRVGVGVLFARDRALAEGMSESRRILSYVETLTQATERQELADRIAQHCAHIAGFQSAVLTVHMDDGPLTGAFNVTADQRAGLQDAAERAPPERSARKRRRLREHAFPKTGIAYIRHDVDLARSAGFVPTDSDEFGSWHPEDRLFILVGAQRGADFGVLSLDLPEDGSAPSRERLGSLHVAESFLQLGATLLQARMIDAHLIRSNRLEALGTLAAGVAHDFNNIIGVMLGYSSLLHMSVKGDENLARMTAAIEESAQRAAALTARLRGLTRGGRGEPVPVNVGALADDCARVAHETFDRRIEITCEIAEGLPEVAGDAAQLYRSLMNICVNARDAMPDGGRVQIAVRPEASPGFLEAGGNVPWVHVIIDDDGPGIDASLQDRIFEPFFTTKVRSENRGLGLFMAYNVCREHQGTIQVTRSPLGGTRVRVMLPGLPPSGSEAGELKRQEAPPTLHTPVPPSHILCVEDEEMIQDLMVTGLELLGHSVDVIGDGQAAIDHLTERSGAYDLLVLDLVLPKRSGLDVFRHLQEVRPDLPVLVSSGNVEEGLQDAELLAKVSGTIPKPWRMEEFQDAVQEVLRMGLPQEPPATG